MKIINIVGARPNFIKAVSVLKEMKKYAFLHTFLVHTGQHYDCNMSDVFFEDLELTAPDIHLGVGSSSHAQQTANIMVKFEKVIQNIRPDLVIVYGEVNSTLACTLTAKKMNVKVAHVEAGLRSFDRTMPEEINRIVTDVLADLLFTPSSDADENLRREGMNEGKIKRVGNIMIDTLVMNMEKALGEKTHIQMGLREKGFIYVTLHRPSNVDHQGIFGRIVNELKYLSGEIPILFSVHPRTKKRLVEFDLIGKLNGFPHILLKEPLGYHDSICLTMNAKFVLTDSGGLQEETTYLKIPCLTLRSCTERPITIQEGTNKLTDIDRFRKDAADILKGNIKEGKIPELWDGKTAERIVYHIQELENNNLII